MRERARLLRWTGVVVLASAGIGIAAAQSLQVAGVYPHLTMYNNEPECGTGAVVPWADRLWAITYGPHSPLGSSDKLYEITPDLVQHIRPESVGGTPANRMIHRESQQLNIGPYMIDNKRNVRVLQPALMPGRLTGTARHLSDPVNKIHIATMEEGLYSVDVHTLGVEEHIKDGNRQPAVGGGVSSKLPGYHGKGLYSSQGVLVYANNGTQGAEAMTNTAMRAGSLGGWRGSGDWELIRENQFTEVTGPGGIYGSSDPDNDPIWSMGWDYRSLILMVLDQGRWHSYRLPKGSHSYDGAHGWNTEWPRIREIGSGDLLATMHGTFWRFPREFTARNSAGIAPRSNYLKVIGDFALWQERVVFGCDDSAQNEFLNTRKFKSDKVAPIQSNSNLWFVEPEEIDKLGPPIGRGAVWLHDALEAGAVSEPYLFDGYDYRMLVLKHDSEAAVEFTLEVDYEGSGVWRELKKLSVDSSLIHIFEAEERGAWIRLRCGSRAAGVAAHFNYRNKDRRNVGNSDIFAPFFSGGSSDAPRVIMRSNRRVMGVASEDSYYEVNSDLRMTSSGEERLAQWSVVLQSVQQPHVNVSADEISVVVIEDGKRYRLPGNRAYMGGANISRDRDEAKSGKPLDEFLEQSLARGAEVRVSGVHESYRGEHIVDGVISDESRWIAAGPGSWVEIDMGESRRFRSLYLATGWKMESQYAVQSFDVAIKEGGHWVTLPGGSIRGNSSIVVPLILAEPVTAQEVKITINDSGFNRIYEVAIFEGVPSVAADKDQGLGIPRICREVATERDLFNYHGTFYELPARNAQGFAKIRPIATHNLQIYDYASHFGLLFLSGVPAVEHERVVCSSDGKAAVWTGVVDELWQLGKPRGEGGVWLRSDVKGGVPSDPYLMTGYDQKMVTLWSDKPTRITLEIDIDGTDVWVPCRSFELKGGEEQSYMFPEGFSAYWVRTISALDVKATAIFRYE